MSDVVPPASPPRLRRWQDVEWWFLAYLGILLFPALFDPTTTAADWIAIAVAVVVFVPIFYAGYLGSERTTAWCAVATTVLGLALFPFNGAATVLFVFAAAFVGSFSSRARAFRWLYVLTAVLLALAVVGATRGVELVYLLVGFLPSIGFVWVIGLSVMGERRREREAARLRVENARIEHLATATERERIARDLHDLLGHTLTSVVVRAQLVQRLADHDPARAGQEAAAIETAARDALAEVRATVAGWRRTGLDEELDAARGALAAAGVELEVVRREELRLAPSIETALALALREAVTNVVRHADARRCTVSIGREGAEIALRVVDDGRGGGRDGGGLSGMRERIAALGGRVDRVDGDGTALTVALPAEVAG